MKVSKQFHDVMDPARATALMRTLGHSDTLGNGDPIPSFAHYLYFWEALQPNQLGRDSHPKLGAFIPDMGLPRRMWAGGDIQFQHPVVAGKPAIKTSTVSKAERKTGRSGPLAVVAVDHVVQQEGQTCVLERQDIVYLPERDKTVPTKSEPKATLSAQHQSNVAFDTTKLFRYSALTFNGHRIHYDLEYCQNVEGYAGLVVHGPLLAQELMLFWEKINGTRLTHFSFRMTAPLMHFEPAVLCIDGNDVWVEGPDRRLCLAGYAE